MFSFARGLDKCVCTIVVQVEGYFDIQALATLNLMSCYNCIKVSVLKSTINSLQGIYVLESLVCYLHCFLQLALKV
jgi:hypothetical protein